MLAINFIDRSIMTTYQRIVLASRPTAEVQADNFRLETAEIPAITEGQLLVRNQYLSLDPYMRGRMSANKSYAAPQALDETMIGGTVGVVLESKHPKFAVGDTVVGTLGWTEVAVSDGTMLRKVDTTHIPASAYLGAVGMPGMTAWYGLNQIMAPKAGETVVVSAASGAVGSVVGQLAKLKGCRVVGIAGYNGEPTPLDNARLILTNRLTVRGFIVSEQPEFWPQGLAELGTLVATGKLKFRESVADGLASAPEAFIGLLKGRNFGKQLVKLG